MREPVPFEVYEPGVFLHGTRADLAVGEMLVPGRESNFEVGRVMKYVFFTATLDAAVWGAELAAGQGRERIYIVAPTGAFEDDPNLTDKKFAGNPTQSFRSREATERSEHYLRALLPADAGRSAVPAAALNAAAQLLALEAGVDNRPAQARVHVPGRSWMTTSAARITATTPNGPSIAVSIEPTPPAERVSLCGRIAGLTRRETDVLGTVVAGHDSRHAARTLAISEHTLQDHLKSIFAKTRTDSRRLLIARATGAKW